MKLSLHFASLLALMIPALLVPALISPAAAQSAADQQTDGGPVMAQFSGSDDYRYPASSALDISGAGTIEFWVQPGRKSDPGYDPAVLSYQGTFGARLAVLISSDAKALIINAGEVTKNVAFDFVDGQMHHIALTFIAETLTVMIDGEVRDTLDLAMANLPVDTFSIGSLGGASPFIGSIGQIRFWDEPVDPDTLLRFAWPADPSSQSEPHPNMDALVGMSAFDNPATGGFVFIGDTAGITASTAKDAPFDESGLDPEDIVSADPT